MEEIREDLQKYKLFTVKQLEPILCKSGQTIIRYLKTGKLKGFKVGKDWRISEAALQEYLGMTGEETK